nr:MAG TPA: hypothetical protein [Caudoviricetes sp.]
MTLYKRLRDVSEQRSGHLMPLSLRYIKILSEAGINWKDLHIIDAFSMVCAINIDKWRLYFMERAKQKMGKQGIKQICRATESDFEAL